MSNKQIVFGAIIGVVIIVGLICAGSLLETVDKGTYHVIQRPVTGTMEAKMETGMYGQVFSNVYTWPKSQTFFFTSDADEGTKHDQSIEVRFNDGSLANLSGTTRVLMPTGSTQAIGLMTDMSFRDYSDLEARFILPIVRNALRLTANLMTARESYAEKRPDFIAWAWDQIQNGVYMTEGKTEYRKDVKTGENIKYTFKVIKHKEDGTPLREHNPLEGTGITLANFEIKMFVYEDKVKEQISEQQENLMAIATARAQAERAEQDARTREARGKADVMTVKYEQLQIKEKAVIKAEADKKVAETQASQRLEVAKFDKLAAAEEKQKQILLGEGEAERKKLVMAADGALKQKLDTIKVMNGQWADAYSKRNVPSFYMAGSGGDATGDANPDNQFTTFMNLMNAKNASSLSLDLQLKGDTSGVRLSK